MRNYKHNLHDKYDSYMPNKPHWVQGEYRVSGESEQFHLGNAYMSNGYGRGTSFGVSKKAWVVSGYGINIDNQYIGKSEQT